MHLILERKGKKSEDILKVHKTPSPSIIPDIDLVYVLSGRSTVLGKDADQLDRPVDLKDDKSRLCKGIEIAKKISAQRLHIPVSQLKPENCTIPIFYNGRKIHNEDLREALKNGKINYPTHLFKIADINPPNTLGQIKSLIDFLQTTEMFIHHIAVVSSAYHLPRVARTLAMESPQTCNENGDLNVLGSKYFSSMGLTKNINSLVFFMILRES